MSEFGKGYAYCLGLFLAHTERIQHYQEINEKLGVLDASMWFNGAADHLYELEIPAQLSPEQQLKATEFQSRCIHFRMCMNGEKCTWEDAFNAVEEAKAMLLEWDLFNNIPAEKGDHT